ncbi:MAG: hypothetical protein ACK573_10325, partial [Pseudanabaena sp.]
MAKILIGRFLESKYSVGKTAGQALDSLITELSRLGGAQISQRGSADNGPQTEQLPPGCLACSKAWARASISSVGR